MGCLITLGPAAIVAVVYLTNIGQIVHGTPNPTRLESIGHRKDRNR